MNDGFRFVTQEINGPDGAVRGFFMSRRLSAPPASAEKFPGVPQVAVLPRRFAEADTAERWLRDTAERGGNAVAVSVGAGHHWLIGAWVAE